MKRIIATSLIGVIVSLIFVMVVIMPITFKSLLTLVGFSVFASSLFVLIREIQNIDKD